MFGAIYAVFLFGMFTIGLLSDLFAGRATRRALLNEAHNTREERNAKAARRAAARAAAYSGHAVRAARAARPWGEAAAWTRLARAWATVACHAARSTDPSARRWARTAARRARGAYLEAKGRT